MLPKVLIVDDSKMFRKLLRKIVGNDYDVVAEACDGNEGLQQHNETHPDLTLLDITMPNCDGRECLTNIIKSNPDSKVVMITGIKDEATMEECLSIGAKGYINKDTIDACDPEAIQQTLNQIKSYMGA